jgi:hypothetical protein
LGHIEIWQPKEEFVNEWRLFSAIDLEPLVLIKWLNYPKKFNMDAPAGDSNDFRRKFFAFDEEFEDVLHHAFISLSVSGKLTFAYHVHNNWITLTHDLKNYGAPISHADINFYSMQSGVLAVSGFNSSLRHTITIYNIQINIKESQLTCSAIQQIDVVSADMPLAVDSLHREHVPVLDQMDEGAGMDDDDEFNPAAINLLETEANTGPVKSPIHISFSPIHWTVFFVVSVASNGDCFLEKWQWTKTQFNFDPSFDLTTAPPTTLDEFRPSYIKLSSRCNPDIVARLLPDQRDPRIGTDFVTDLKVTENNLAVLSFIDGHVELYDGNSLKLVGTFEGHRSEMFVEDGFNGIKQESETVDDILGIDMGDMDVKSNNKRKFALMAQMGEVDEQPNIKRRKITSMDSQNTLVDTTHLISSLGLDAGSRMNKTSKRPPVPVSVTFSPNNNCCMAVLYYNTELQLVPLAPVYPSQSNFTPARWIANLFQLSIARNTDFWDILALLCTWTHLPKYRGMYKEVLLYLLQDWEYLQPAYKSFIFAQHEAIKSAIYRSVPNMSVNYANSQSKLFINYILQIFRFSIRNTTVIQTNFMDREDEVDPSNQNTPTPFIESLAAQNTNVVIVPFDKEAIQTLSPFVDWFIQYSASARKGLQSFIVRHSPQQLQQHGSLLGPYLNEFHQLEVKPTNVDQFFAVASDDILDYGVDLICDRDTYFTMREVSYYTSLYARQKFTLPNPLSAAAKAPSVPGAVPPQQQQVMQQKRTQLVTSLQSINRLANQIRRMLFAYGVRADSFALDEVPKRVETIIGQLMGNIMKQQRQGLTVYSLSQTVPAALDLMPYRFKVLETNMMGAQGYLVDNKTITDVNSAEQPSEMHFYHLHNTFYLKRTKLKDLQASDMLDVVTHIKLQPKDYVRQCTRCNRISALINKSTVQWYNQWVYACPVCAGRWKKVPIE